MDDLAVKIKELEMKIEELESLQEDFQETIRKQLNNNDVRVLLGQILDEKQFATTSFVEQKISSNQVQLIMWIVGTAISVISILYALK